MNEDIADIRSTEYKFTNHTQSLTTVRRNCTQGTLYADTFTLTINNFTLDKSGYYWCQILINDSFTQPSQRAWFYATDSCIRQDPYFRSVHRDQAQCALVSTGTKPFPQFRLYLADSINLN